MEIDAGPWFFYLSFDSESVPEVKKILHSYNVLLDPETFPNRSGKLSFGRSILYSDVFFAAEPEPNL